MDNYAREVRPSMPTHRVGALDLSPKTPWAEVDLKSLRWKYHTNSKIISTSTYLINLDSLRSFTAIPESLRKTDTEKRRKAKHYTKSLMFPRTSTTMSNYLSCPQSSHCLHKLEQRQQNKLGETTRRVNSLLVSIMGEQHSGTLPNQGISYYVSQPPSLVVNPIFEIRNPM